MLWERDENLGQDETVYPYSNTVFEQEMENTVALITAGMVKKIVRMMQSPRMIQLGVEPPFTLQLTHDLVETALIRFYTQDSLQFPKYSGWVHDAKKYTDFYSFAARCRRLRLIVESASGKEENFAGMRKDLHKRLADSIFQQFDRRNIPYVEDYAAETYLNAAETNLNVSRDLDAQLAIAWQQLAASQAKLAASQAQAAALQAQAAE